MNFEILKECALFQGISEEELREMLKCLGAVTGDYEKGECIFRRGERISSVAVLLEGCVHIQKEDYWGNLSILSEIVEGEVFGEVYACLGEEMLHSAVAVRRSRVLFLDVERVLKVCSETCRFHGRLVRNLLVVMAGKNRGMARKVEHMAQRTTREKVLSYLSEQALKAGEEEFVIGFNRQQLADFLGVERSALSRELGRMKKEGILEFEGRRFRLR
ncbi:MAG: Crp/Fnr family transcriptional regulator [Eubacteriales bacterium]|nr:Crp/Fnr family transcriptional regulator [Eubacteriales bacterium]